MESGYNLTESRECATMEQPDMLTTGVLLTCPFCFGVVDFSRVDESDDINGDAVQL